MPFEGAPPSACWQHQGLRSGFEVVYFNRERTGLRVDGTTTGLQDGDMWVVTYRLHLNGSWSTLAAQIVSRRASEITECRLQSDGAGHWVVNGERADDLDGCVDVDLESSAMTNALPVHRLGLAVGDCAAAPAAYVGIDSRTVGKLDQSYLRLDDNASGQRYEYEAPSFDFRCRLTYDKSGLVLEYPGIAVRAA